MTKTYIIAEAGVNHNGSIEIAKQLIDVAAAAGADAVKFQTFKTSALVTKNAPKADYQMKQSDLCESQYDMLKKLELSVDDHAILIEHCYHQQIQFLSTPFDEESVELLANKLNLPKLKISSGEITNVPLLLKAARTKKPIILSTGMASLSDIEFALSVIAFGYVEPTNEHCSIDSFFNIYRTAIGQQYLKDMVSLLHCTTEYPAPFNEVNLKVINTLKNAFGLPVGYSDHTAGIEVSIAAVALGATIIEKHFTIDKELPGPDHQASLDPSQLKSLVGGIRNIESALGNGLKIPSPAEFKNRNIARKSIVALCNIRAGETFTEKNIGLKRPGGGISGVFYWEWIGKTSKRNYQENELLENI